MRGVPAAPGILSPEQVRQTADTIARSQLPSGAIAWYAGGHVDPWDHVQAAMALSASGHIDRAALAYDWLRRSQRADGSWAIRYRDGTVEDPHTDSNFCAYLATGVWHHWLITSDQRFVEAMWPAVARGIEVVLGMQRVDGAVAWARTERGPESDALVTGNASIHLSLRCAIALARVVGEMHPDWELAAGRIRHALDDHPEVFAHKATHSMDWYYPLLGASVPRDLARARIAMRWDEFVVDGLGTRCVSTNPWVTGAETCELALALDAVGCSDAAREQLAAMQHLRADDGSYWTGLVFDEGVRWPAERTTWTAATVILAVDALCGATPAAGVFRGEGLPDCAWAVSQSCPTHP